MEPRPLYWDIFPDLMKNISWKHLGMMNLREFSYDIKFMLKNDVEVNELDAIDMGELSNECALGRCDFTSTQILSALR